MATALVSRKLVALGINIGFGARKKLNKLKKNVTAYFLFIYFLIIFTFSSLSVLITHSSLFFQRPEWLSVTGLTEGGNDAIS